jgi:hypothetical protein
MCSHLPGRRKTIHTQRKERNKVRKKQIHGGGGGGGGGDAWTF